MKVLLSDITDIYENYIRRTVKNKRKIFDFEKNKLQYLVDIKRTLENNTYNGGQYNIFLIKKPKTRIIMSQSIYDKIINHYVARKILMPKLSKYLNDRNCATRINMGSTYAIRLLKKDIESFKKYEKFYFLKLDIEKYFYNIDHTTLLKLVKDDLADEELNLVKVILDSTNKEYINNKINYFEEKINEELPRYYQGKGLPIGNMTSQFLAIFYLSKLQYFLRHNLRLKYINYMDDFIILNEDKDYLKKCLEVIKEKLEREYKLNINAKKTKIMASNIGVNFLGYHFKVINNKTVVKLSQSTKQAIKKGVKKSLYSYQNGKINFKQFFSSIENYKYSYLFIDKVISKDIIDKIIG